MLFFRYHAPRRERPAPWQQASKPSARRPHQEQYRGWQLEVTHRRVGITVQREQYRAVARNPDLGADHALGGFSSLNAALDAARRWIDSQETRYHLLARRRRAQQHRRKARSTQKN